MYVLYRNRYCVRIYEYIMYNVFLQRLYQIYDMYAIFVYSLINNLAYVF